VAAGPGDAPPGPKWQLGIERSCRRSGICTAVAPGHFEVGPDHRTRVRAGLVEPDPQLLLAAEACPAEAITIITAG
jgi:ferredoxin